MMETQTVMFVGPQGSGKGTQAALTARFLSRTDSPNKVLHFETGNEFRNLTEEDTYTAQRVEETLSDGDMQPTFLATFLWTKAFIEELTPQKHLILDGSPRTLPEAKMLNQAFDFYHRNNLTVIHLSVSEDTTYKRLQGRGRHDDSKKAIAHRLDLYKEKTLPVVDFYKESKGYAYVQIDGEQQIKKVHKKIVSALKNN